MRQFHRFVFAALLLVIASTQAFAQDPPPTTGEGWLERIQHRLETEAQEINLRAPEAANLANEMGPDDQPANALQYSDWQIRMKRMIKMLGDDEKYNEVTQANIETAFDVISAETDVEVREAQMDLLADYQVALDGQMTALSTITENLREVATWMVVVDLWFDFASDFKSRVQSWRGGVQTLHDRIYALRASSSYMQNCYDFYLWWTTYGQDELRALNLSFDNTDTAIRSLVYQNQHELGLLPLWIATSVFGVPDPVAQLVSEYNEVVVEWNVTVADYYEWYSDCLMGANENSYSGTVMIDGQLYFYWTVQYYTAEIVSTYGETGVCLQSYLVNAVYITDARTVTALYNVVFVPDGGVQCFDSGGYGW